MRSENASVVSALSLRALVARDFIWVIPKNRSTAEAEPAGFWSGIGPITCDVIDAISRATIERTFAGSGSLIQIGPIALVADISIRTVDVVMSQIDESVLDAIRTYDMRNAPVQIYRGYFDPETRLLINAAVPRFVGFVDQASITTPSENQEGGISLSLVSHTRELTRSSPLVRSDEAQRSRDSNDEFRIDAASVGDWQVYWGRNKGPVT